MKKSLSLLSLLLISYISSAQFGSLGLSLGLPQNEFRENTDATGFGFDLSAGFPFQKGAPIYFGIDINYLVYGSNRQDEDLSAEIRTTNGFLIETINIPLRIVNTNSIFGTHAFLRAQAPFKIVKPYVEGLVGFRYISTVTRIEDRSSDNRFSDEDSNLIERKTVLDDFIFSYGYGGGFMIGLGGGFSIDLRANFFKGQRAQYYDGNDTEAWSVEFTGSPAAFDPDNIEEGDLTYDVTPRESTTDLLILKLGVAYIF